jgi:hypothetical protein
MIDQENTLTPGTGVEALIMIVEIGLSKCRYLIWAGYFTSVEWSRVPSNLTTKSRSWLTNIRVNCLIILVVTSFPLDGIAACVKNEPNQLWNYVGQIAEKRVKMTLILSGEEVTGQYFYTTLLHDISLQGRIKDGKDISLDELSADGKVVAQFNGHFADATTHKEGVDGKLECDVIAGYWRKKGHSKKRSVYLSLESITAGTLTSRYLGAGAQDDDLVNREAYRFWLAVKQNNMKAVASQIAYPLEYTMNEQKKKCRTAAEFMADYDVVITKKFREEIIKATPHNMFSNDQGVMLGNGEVWFNSSGKVVALNTQ